MKGKEQVQSSVTHSELSVRLTYLLTAVSCKSCTQALVFEYCLMLVCRVWQSFTRFCACYGNSVVVFYGRKEKIVSEFAKLCTKGFTAFF